MIIKYNMDNYGEEKDIDVEKGLFCYRIGNESLMTGATGKYDFPDLLLDLTVLTVNCLEESMTGEVDEFIEDKESQPLRDIPIMVDRVINAMGDKIKETLKENLIKYYAEQTFDGKDINEFIKIISESNPDSEILAVDIDELRKQLEEKNGKGED